MSGRADRARSPVVQNRCFTVLVLLLSGCQLLLIEEDRPCPCADPLVCCDGLCTEASDCPIGGWGEEAVLESVSPSCYDGTTSARNADGKTIAVRLPPTGHPFAFERISYIIEDDWWTDVQCDRGQAHEVLLFSAVGEPPAEPFVERRIDVPATLGLQTPREVELVLDEPVIVAEGDLFVAIPFNRNPPTRPLCLRVCDADVPDRTYVSFLAAPPPYGWVEVKQATGLRKNVGIRATGRPWVR